MTNATSTNAARGAARAAGSRTTSPGAAQRPSARPTGAALAGADLQVVHIACDLIDPAPWNPNVVPPDVMHKLREYIRKEGLVQPLVVRRLGERYQMVGGHHRLQVCRDELGYSEVPCVVVDVDEKRAKILAVNLNELSGDPVPALMAELVHDLSRDTSLDDLSTLLPYSTAELKDFEELLKLPDGLMAWVEEEAKRQADAAPKVLSFVVDDTTVIEQAVGHAMERLEGKNRRGRALGLLALAYLEANDITPLAPDAANQAGADATDGEA
jgi:hypothetical protein